MIDDEWKFDWIFDNYNVFDSDDNDVKFSLFLKISSFIELNDIFNDIINAIQVFTKNHDYSIIKHRIKLYIFKRFNVVIDVLYVKCSKNDKIEIFKIIKRKREIFKIIDCFFNIIARENKNI